MGDNGKNEALKSGIASSNQLIDQGREAYEAGRQDYTRIKNLMDQSYQSDYGRNAQDFLNKQTAAGTSYAGQTSAGLARNAGKAATETARLMGGSRGLAAAQGAKAGSSAVSQNYADLLNQGAGRYAQSAKDVQSALGQRAGMASGQQSMGLNAQTSGIGGKTGAAGSISTNAELVAPWISAGGEALTGGAALAATLSDERLKDNIMPVDDFLARLNAISGGTDGQK